MRITTLMILTFALGAAIGCGCNEALKTASPDTSVDAASAGADASAGDALTPDAAVQPDAKAGDAGSDTDSGE